MDVGSNVRNGAVTSYLCVSMCLLVKSPLIGATTLRSARSKRPSGPLRLNAA